LEFASDKAIVSARLALCISDANYTAKLLLILLYTLCVLTKGKLFIIKISRWFSILISNYKLITFLSNLKY